MHNQFHMSAFLLMFGFLAFAAFDVRGDIDCSQYGACQNGNYNSSSIDCHGYHGCQESYLRYHLNYIR